MANVITLPMLGQTMEEGTISKWFKQEGDIITAGEPLYEVMTDKVNMEVEAPESGVLRKIIAKVDDTIPILEPVAIIGTADESIDGLLSGGQPAAPAQEQPKEVAAPAVAPAAAAASVSKDTADVDRVFASPRAKRVAMENGVQVSDLAGRGTGPEGRIVEKDVLAYVAEGAVKATPLASKIADVEGVNLRNVAGTGTGGRVVRDDVLRAAAPAAQPESTSARVVPFAGMRKRIADNVSKSAQTAPHVTLTTEVDMTEAVELRKKIVGEFEKRYGVRVTFTDFIVKAAALTLLNHPMINSALQGNEIRLFDSVNMGLAVTLDDGLIVPVIKDAEKKSISEISIEAKQLAEKARSNSITGADLAGGTFTISNLGAFGIEMFNPIITPGQTAILGVCRIAEKPVVMNGQIVIRSMMNLCLSFDHRIVDGAPAAKFLQELKNKLESPLMLLV